MDVNYFYSLLSFLVGAVSGFQFVAEKHREAPFRAAWTWAGRLYLFLRGLVSAVVFLILYLSSSRFSIIRNWPLPLVALACGTGAEIILRTKIFIREKKKPGGGVEEVFLEPLKLLLWFQDFFLTKIGEQLKISRARAKRDRLKANLPKDIGFPDLCKLVTANLRAFDPNTIEVQQIHEIIQALLQAYQLQIQSGLSPVLCDDDFKHTLGYKLLHHVSEAQFLLLMAQVA
jgi:hypothetical protein